jgi:hypothetical protein
MSKTFFSFLRLYRMTETWKTSRMVARNVVHDEFSGALAKSTQIRTAQGCRIQMAASLAIFFIAPSRSRSPIEPFTLLAHGFRMSSSLNDKCFFS